MLSQPPYIDINKRPKEKFLKTALKICYLIFSIVFGFNPHFRLSKKITRERRTFFLRFLKYLLF